MPRNRDARVTCACVQEMTSNTVLLLLGNGRQSAEIHDRAFLPRAHGKAISFVVCLSARESPDLDI